MEHNMVLDSLIEAVGANNFIDEVLAHLPATQRELILKSIADNHGLTEDLMEYRERCIAEDLVLLHSLGASESKVRGYEKLSTAV